MMRESHIGAKKAYVTPQFCVHGTLAELTAMPDKDYGPSDGFTFQGVSITTVS
jgi:hypothetical protein